jgi:hypothetical protein
MEYLIPILLVLLLAAGFVTFVVLNATRRSNVSSAEDSERSDPKGMAATDPSPLGTTTEHAGTQSSEGHTVEEPERDGGVTPKGAPSGEGGDRADDRRDVAPESEQLANRPV